MNCGSKQHTHNKNSNPSLPTLKRLPKSALALSVALAAPAFAVENDRLTLEEVIVTAEHREASVHDTQISISAFSSSDVQDLGISNSSDLANVAPNLTVATYQGGRTGVGINMRGMGQNETLITFDPAVGVYIDDVLIAKNVGAMLDVVDMERIEILRGPQGTLYGRNTMGGTVNYVTIKPTNEFEGRVTATAGSFNQRDIKGVINLPMGETFAARLSAASLKRDGTIDNDLAGAANSELDTRDRLAALLHLQWQPTDNFSLLYSYDRTRIDEVPGTPWLTGINSESFVGGLVAPWAIDINSDRPDSIEVDGIHRAETEVDGHSFHVDYDINEALTFKSIIAYREMDNTGAGDSDGSPLTVIDTLDVQSSKQVSQEFRLLGSALDNQLSFTVGLFFMSEKGDVDNGLAVFGTLGREISSFKNDNAALYGQGTYYATDRFNITAGIRYTEETKQMDRFEVGGETFDYPTAKRDFDNISPMLSFGYDFTDDLMSYFKISSGYQSGGFNARESNPDAFVEGFDEETLIAYELGLKASIADRVRINGALWYSDYDDKRVNNFNPDTLSNTVRNAGVVEIYGAELELMAQVSSVLQLSANFGYTKPEFVEYNSPNPENPSEIIDLSDQTNFPYTPEKTAGASIVYENHIGFASLRARLDWAYKDRYNFLAPVPELNYQRSYNVWNGRVTMEEIQVGGDATLRVSLWGKNLTDESYFTTGVNVYNSLGFNFNLYADPRTYGVDVELNF